MNKNVFTKTCIALSFFALFASNAIKASEPQDTGLTTLYKEVQAKQVQDKEEARKLVVAREQELARASKTKSETKSKLVALEKEVADLEASIIKEREKLQEEEKLLRKEKENMDGVFNAVSRHEKLLKETIQANSLGHDFDFKVEESDYSLDRISTLWTQYLKAITLTEKVQKLNGTVFDEKGQKRETTVTLAGPFGAFADGAWLKYLPKEKAWSDFATQAPVTTDTTVSVDPTFGKALERYDENHDEFRWIKPAGIIGVIIGLLSIIALGLAVARYLTLKKISKVIASDSLNGKLSKTNPLFRIEAASKSGPNPESAVEGQLLEETSRVKRGLGTLAVLTGIPTLLGLLGTVSGMIKTFTVMSAFGSADPELLAGGIAEALVTTELGLMVAIPLLLIYAFIKSKADSLADLIEGATLQMLSK